MKKILKFSAGVSVSSAMRAKLRSRYWLVAALLIGSARTASAVPLLQPGNKPDPVTVPTGAGPKPPNSTPSGPVTVVTPGDGPKPPGIAQPVPAAVAVPALVPAPPPQAPPPSVSPPQGLPSLVSSDAVPPKPPVVDTKPVVPGAGGLALVPPPVNTVPASQGSAPTAPDVQPLVTSSTPGAAMVPAPVSTQTTSPAGSDKVPPQGANAPTSSQNATLNEVLPTAAALASSMQEAPAVNAQSQTNVAAVTAIKQPLLSAASCVGVTFRPNKQRSDTTLVDFTGDGLIVAAIANERINTAFAKAGYNAIEILKPVRWCVNQNTVRELMQSGLGADAQHASLLVQIDNGWQLMTQEQWGTHQAQVRSLTAVNSSAIPASPASPEVSPSSKTGAGQKAKRLVPLSTLLAKLKTTGQNKADSSQTATPSVQLK